MWTVLYLKKNDSSKFAKYVFKKSGYDCLRYIHTQNKSTFWLKFYVMSKIFNKISVNKLFLRQISYFISLLWINCLKTNCLEFVFHVYAYLNSYSCAATEISMYRCLIIYLYIVHLTWRCTTMSSCLNFSYVDKHLKYPVFMYWTILRLVMK